MSFQILLLTLDDLRTRNHHRKIIEIETVITIIQPQFMLSDEQTEAAIKCIKSVTDNQSTFGQSLFTDTL